MMRQSGEHDVFDGHKRSGAGSGDVDAPGILDCRVLPDRQFSKLWEAIILDQSQKDRILAQAILNFTVRCKVDRSRLPLHGLILLYGPPGTGKTSIARALASRVAETIGASGQFLFIEVEPHALASAALGKSQRAVRDLLGVTIAEQATRGPLIVLLDEVETLAADRSKMSLEANPIDVHRATDAVLAQLDQLAVLHPNLLFVATSNFTRAIDQAFVSRADLIELVDLPGPEACRKILVSAVEALVEVFPGAQGVLRAPEFEQAVSACVGLDGRQIRKLVLAACSLNKTTALNPGALTCHDLLRVAELTGRQTLAFKESRQ